MDHGRAFVERSRAYLLGEYLPKIRGALEGLTPEDLWWRPNEASNSIGNLVLHLAGNARQWVVSGIGGEPDVRRRQEEFQRREGMDAGELVAHLEGALAEVDTVLARLEPGDLDGTRIIQGLEVSVLGALYHVVEHFAMHTGQILYVAKMRANRDLGFYQVRDGNVTTHW